MSKKKPSLIYLIGAFAAGFALVAFFRSRKQEDKISALPPQTGNDLDVSPSTTPVTGTSESILNGLSENEANNLKQELS